MSGVRRTRQKESHEPVTSNNEIDNNNTGAIVDEDTIPVPPSFRTEKQQKETSNYYWWFIRWGLAAAFLVFSLVIVDAFLLKYNAGFTFAGIFDQVRLGAIYVISTAGYFVGRLMNVWQLFWDALDQVWQVIKEFLPLREFEMARDAMMKVLAQTGYLVAIGWLVEFISGFRDALLVNWQLGIIFSLCVIGLVVYRLIK